MTNVDLRVADASDLPFPDDTFDLVTSNLGLNNFEDPDAVMREVARVSRNGARLAFTTNPVGTMPEVYEVLRRVLIDAAPAAVGGLDAQERHRGTIESAHALLTGAGYRVTRTITERFEMRFADGTALLHHGLCAWLLEGWRSVVPAAAEEEVFAKVEEEMNRQAEGGAFVTSIKMAFIEAELSK